MVHRLLEGRELPVSHESRAEVLQGALFRADGCPRYYHNRTQPIDSQCAAQAIETLSRFSDLDPESLGIAERVAQWTIRHMQAPDGHFYYRAYPVIKAKAPMFHWAQATIYRGLTMLVDALITKTTRRA